MSNYGHLGIPNNFSTDNFLFFQSFFALFRPNGGPEMGDLEHPKLNFFSNLNNIPYHIELSLNHLLITYLN